MVDASVSVFQYTHKSSGHIPSTFDNEPVTCQLCKRSYQYVSVGVLTDVDHLLLFHQIHAAEACHDSKIYND